MTRTTLKIGAGAVAGTLLLGGGLALAEQSGSSPAPAETAVTAEAAESAVAPVLESVAYESSEATASSSEASSSEASASAEAADPSAADESSTAAGRPVLRGRLARAVLQDDVPDWVVSRAAERLGVSEDNVKSVIAQSRTLVAKAYGMSESELSAAVKDGTLPRLSPDARTQLVTQLKALRDDAGWPTWEQLRAARAAKLGVSVDTLKEYRGDAAKLVAEAHGMTVPELRAQWRTGKVERLTPEQRTELRTKLKDLRGSLGITRPDRTATTS